MKSIFEKMLSLDATEQSTLIGKMRDVKLGTKADLERQLRDVAKAVEQAETAKTQAAKEKVRSNRIKVRKPSQDLNRLLWSSVFGRIFSSRF